MVEKFVSKLEELDYITTVISEWNHTDQYIRLAHPVLRVNAAV